jgi:putative SOS response-associated peptidase YedK
MCGRYVQTSKVRRHVRSLAEIEGEQPYTPDSWNVAPSHGSLVLRSRAGKLAADWLTWGLSEGPPATIKPINARIESASTKPTFREAWQMRRAIIGVDGWFEWQSRDGQKQPFYFRRQDGEAMLFGGLWTGDTYCLITTAADGHLAQIHDRRPLSVKPDDVRRWINEAPASVDEVVARAVPPDEIVFFPISPRVNRTNVDRPELIEPVVLTNLPPKPQQIDLL